MHDLNPTLDQVAADGQHPPPEVPPRNSALATALAAIARLSHLKRPRSRVLHRCRTRPSHAMEADR
jgi:hypothetical protein